MLTVGTNDCEVLIIPAGKERKYHMDSTCLGYTDADTIQLAGREKPKVVFGTLIHEVMHKIDDEYHVLVDIDEPQAVKERIIHAFANGLVDTLVRNGIIPENEIPQILEKLNDYCDGSHPLNAQKAKT